MAQVFLALTLQRRALAFEQVAIQRRSIALANDYAVMRPIFMREPLPFEQVMRQLAVAEQTINGL